MSKVVESTVSVSQVDKNVLKDAINLLLNQENAVLSNSDTYVVWGKKNKTKGTLVFLRGLGYADIYIENGQLKVNADEMYKSEILNMLKQKYVAAYVMKKLKAKMTFDANSHKIKLEVPV